MTLGIWFGQFNITGGQVEEEGPYVGIFEGTRTAAGVGVYAVAEPVNGASARLCNEVLETIARAFGTPEQALTANLLRAVAAAHDHVRAFNRMRSSDRTVGVGLSCLATRGDEAYLAQCGPSLAVAYAGGRFRVAAPAGDDSRRPLGFSERAAPVFTRFSLHVSDVILLTFSAADRMLGRGALINLVNSPPENALPELYLKARQAGEFAGIYLGVIEQPVAVEAAQPLPNARPYAPRAVAGVASGRRPSPADPSEMGWDDTDSANYGDNGGVTMSAVRDRVSRSASLSRQAAQRALGSLGDGSSQLSRRTLVIIAVAAAIVLILILTVPALARHGADDHYAELYQSAATLYDAARGSADPAQRRTLLNHAEADLIEAKTIHPDSADVNDLLANIGEERAALDGLRELAEPVVLADLSDAGVTHQAVIELVVAGRVYVLDAAAGRVLAYESAGGAQPGAVFDEGRMVAGVATGKARHITVLPDAGEGTGTLLVLDSNRRLFALGANGLALVPLPEPDLWKSDTAITASNSALYVLDAAGNQVWRYSSNLQGYDDKPEPLVAKGNLRDAVAISMGSTPIVATNTGKLLRISDGRDDELKIAGLDRALMAPSAPQFNPADGLLYIPDRGNQRIVQVDAAGAFKGQLVQRRLTSLRALAFDDSRGMFYAVSGQILQQFDPTR